MRVLFGSIVVLGTRRGLAGKPGSVKEKEEASNTHSVFLFFPLFFFPVSLSPLFLLFVIVGYSGIVVFLYASQQIVCVHAHNCVPGGKALEGVWYVSGFLFFLYCG